GPSQTQRQAAHDARGAGCGHTGADLCEHLAARAADDDTGRLGNNAAGVGHGYPNAFLSDVKRQNPHADFLAAVIRSSRTLAVTTSFTSARTTDGSLTPPCPILSCPPPPPPSRSSSRLMRPASSSGSAFSSLERASRIDACFETRS